MGGKIMKPQIDEIEKYKNEYDIIPVFDELLSDFTTPMNVLRNIKEISDKFYLLESVDNSHFGRYSYLGYDPILTISCKDNIVCENEIQQMFADVLICQQLALEIALKLKRNVDHPRGLHKVVVDKNV